MAKTTYTVTGPLAVVRDDAGKIRYYYQGAVLPADLPKGELDRLVDTGLVGKQEDLIAQPVEEVPTSPSTTVSSSPPIDPDDVPTTKATRR